MRPTVIGRITNGEPFTTLAVRNYESKQISNTTNVQIQLWSTDSLRIIYSWIVQSRFDQLLIYEGPLPNVGGQTPTRPIVRHSTTVRLDSHMSVASQLRALADDKPNKCPSMGIKWCCLYMSGAEPSQSHSQSVNPWLQFSYNKRSSSPIISRIPFVPHSDTLTCYRICQTNIEYVYILYFI